MKYSLVMFNGHPEKCQKLLNEFADKGWEIVSVSSDHAGVEFSRFLITMRKPK